MAVSATRTIRVRFDGSAKDLIAAAAAAGFAIEGFEKQAKKSSKNLAITGSLMGDSLLDSLGALPAQLKGAAIVAAAGIGTVMAPALASAIISGTLLAVGGGVLAAGIVGAARSPKVKKAWEKFGRQASVVFERFSQPFIDPLVKAARTFGFALARMEPTIKRIGETMAPFVNQISFAAAAFVEKLLPGILEATKQAQPFISVLAVHLPLLAESISRFFFALSAGSDSALVFFERFLIWVEDIIPKLGGILAWLANLGPKIDTFTGKLSPLREALGEVGRFIVEGMRSAREMFSTWLDDNKVRLDVFITQLGGFVKDTGPAFKLAIQGIAIAFIVFAQNVILLVNALDRLKNWWHANKGWIMQFNPLLARLIGFNERGLPGVGARAKGGPVMAGRDYLVGEEGPEILRMGSRSGTIVPNHAISSGAGGDMPPIIIENHIEIGGEVVRVVRTEIKASNRATKRAVLAGAYAR